MERSFFVGYFFDFVVFFPLLFYSLYRNRPISFFAKVKAEKKIAFPAPY